MREGNNTEMRYLRFVLSCIIVLLFAVPAEAQNGDWSPWQSAATPDSLPVITIQYHWRSSLPCYGAGCQLSVELRNMANSATQFRYSIYYEAPSAVFGGGRYLVESKPITGDASLKPFGGSLTGTGAAGDTTNSIFATGSKITRVVVEVKASAATSLIAYYRALDAAPRPNYWNDIRGRLPWTGMTDLQFRGLKIDARGGVFVDTDAQNWNGVRFERTMRGGEAAQTTTFTISNGNPFPVFIDYYWTGNDYDFTTNSADHVSYVAFAAGETRSFQFLSQTCDSPDGCWFSNRPVACHLKIITTDQPIPMLKNIVPQ